MNNICFVLNGSLPVPAIKGGAIEQLVEILIKQNEDYHAFEFLVIGPYYEDTIFLKKNYQHTKFIDIKYSKIWNQRLGTFRAVINKFFHKDYALLSAYNYKVEQYLLKNGNTFDYIINEHADDGLFLRPAKKYGKEKFINHLHMTTKANEIILRAFQSYISVSQYVQDYFIETSNNLNRQYAILYNRVEIQKFNKALSQEEYKQMKEKLGFKNEDFIVTYCGRIKNFKGIKELVKTILSIENKHIKLMVIGASETTGKVSSYESEVKELTQREQERFVFTGYINNADLYKYYKISDIGVIPTTCEEAFNMVILEMMASGLPTIATKSGGMVEVGDDTTTIYIDKGPHLIDNLRNAILQLFESSQQRQEMRVASKERAKLFDSSQYLLNFRDIISRLRKFDKKMI